MTQAEARETGQMLGGDPLDLPFTIEEYRARLGRVHGEMAALDLDLLLVHPLENTYWLTGYRTIGFYSYMCLMVAPGAAPLIMPRSSAAWTTRWRLTASAFRYRFAASMSSLWSSSW